MVNGDVLFLSVGPPVESPALWSMEKMKAYFSVIRRLQPQVSEQAQWILTRYYQLQRQRDDRNAARTTIRMLESLSRLAEGGDGVPRFIRIKLMAPGQEMKLIAVFADD